MTEQEIKKGIISPLKEKIKKEHKSSVNTNHIGVEEALFRCF